MPRDGILHCPFRNDPHELYQKEKPTPVLWCHKCWIIRRNFECCKSGGAFYCWYSKADELRNSVGQDFLVHRKAFYFLHLGRIQPISISSFLFISFLLFESKNHFWYQLYSLVLIKLLYEKKVIEVIYCYFVFLINLAFTNTAACHILTALLHDSIRRSDGNCPIYQPPFLLLKSYW